MELIVSISRAKGKSKGGFFIIIITQGAKVPRGTLATTMFRNGIKLTRIVESLRSCAMAPFTEVIKLVKILHIVPAKMHFALSCITIFQPCGTKR